MRGAAIMVCLFAVGCGGHHEPSALHGPPASQHMRCTLRISPGRILVDGEPRSRAEAVAYCKGTAGAVVVIEDAPKHAWDETAGTMVVIEHNATKAEWDQTRSALQREGVRIYVRGPLCDGLDRFSCGPRRAAVEPPQPVRVIVASPPR